MIAIATSERRNGTSPLSISYARTPTAYRSAAGPTSVASACSGAMYAGVPSVVPLIVNGFPPASCSTLATPKSAILTPPFEVTITFSGLRSRWTTPRA
jgi:hypothetical protein